jgi:hypothetical protein
MTKLTKYLALLALIVQVLEFVIKRLPLVEKLRFLTISLFSVNALELLLAVLLVMICYNLLPPRFEQLRRKKRAAHFQVMWDEFKRVLVEFSTTENKDLQCKYSDLRKGLEKEFNYFVPSMLRIQKASHRGDTSGRALSNFEQCFSVPDISEWQRKVLYRKPEELDCFDSLLVSLREHCTSPEYWDRGIQRKSRT